MATYRGTDGVIFLDYQGWSPAGPIKQVEVQSFSLSSSVALVGDNSLGDEFDTHLVGRKSWTGTITSNFDMTQQFFDIDKDPDLTELTAQIGPAYIGQQIEVDLYPTGDNNTLNDQIQITGIATVTGFELSNSHDNSIVTMTLAVTGDGLLTNQILA
jgi:hypothetical protein